MYKNNNVRKNYFACIYIRSKLKSLLIHILSQLEKYLQLQHARTLYRDT